MKLKSRKISGKVLGEGYVIVIPAGWIHGLDGRSFYTSEHEARANINNPFTNSV